MFEKARKIYKGIITEVMDKTKTIPLYSQLKLKLQDRILLGELSPGVLLPTEQQLCLEYGVSRITVRKALEELERNDLIDRVQGRGTIVKKRNVSRQEMEVRGYSKSMMLQGLTPRSELLEKKLIKGNPTLLEMFQLPATETPEFWVFRRLRYLNNTPAVIMNHYVRKELGDLMLQYDLGDVSFYSIYETILKQQLHDSEGLITAVLASPENAHLLGVDVGTPLIWYRGITYIVGKITVEINYSLFLADKFQFETHMFKPHNIDMEIERNMT